MSTPVITVASGGIGVTEVSNGAPVAEVTNGFGRAVTKIASGGMPVTFTSVAALNSRFTALGDSLTSARGFAGMFDWALFLTRGRYYGRAVGAGPTGWNQGVVGNTTQMMIDRWANVAAENPKSLPICGGCNDITNSGGTFASVTTNLRTLINNAKAIGATPVLVTIPPGNTTNVYIGAMETIRQQCNAWAMQQTDANPVNLDTVLTNIATMYNPDGKHLNGTGAQLAGQAIAAKLNSLIASSEILYDPAAIPAENLYANSTFSAGSPVATSWTFFQNTNGLTKAASKSTLDGYATQRYVATGTCTSQVADNFNQNVTPPGGLTGDLYEAWVEVQVTKSTGLAGLSISAGNNSGNNTMMSITAADAATLSVPFRGVLRAPPSPLPSNGATFNSRISILPSNGAVCDIDMQFLRAGYRKVPTGQ